MDRSAPPTSWARQGSWGQVWERFAEAPDASPHLPDLLRRARPQQLALFDTIETWPQDNEAAEHALRDRLNVLPSLHSAQARAELRLIEQEHGPRRSWVWARLGHSPLAAALAHLGDLATYTTVSLGGTHSELIESYTGHGWQADAAALSALASVEHPADVAAVSAALRAIYQPWLEQSARAFQGSYAPTAHALPQTSAQIEPGTCLLFCDALRYDLAQRLAVALKQHGQQCVLEAAPAPFPGITPTAKPAITPVAGCFSGNGSGNLTPLLTDRGTAANAEALRNELARIGFQILSGDATGDPSGRAWSECGAIDSYGHQHGWRLAHHVSSELRTIERRVRALLQAGWKPVIVITDHGWLLLPGGLPKVELYEQATALRKERCARLKPFAETGQRSLPWFWDPTVLVATPPGIACYEAGHEYAHGGLSPQECITPRLLVSAGAGAAARVTRAICSGRFPEKCATTPP